MRFKTYIVILIVPAVLWMLWAGLRTVGLKVTGRHFTWPHGIVWDTPSGRLHSEFYKKETGQKKDLFILRIVNDATGMVVYEKGLPVEKSKGGGGFIMAAQADKDPELEIVYYTRKHEGNIFVDVTGSTVEERPFNKASEELKTQASSFLMFYAPEPYKVGLALFITMLYYVVVFPGILILDMLKKRNYY